MQKTHCHRGIERFIRGLEKAFRFLRTAGWLILSVLVTSASAQADPVDGNRQLEQIQSAMPARIEIVTAPGVVSYRSAVRLFALSVQREFHSTIGFPYPGAESPAIRIEVGFPQPFAMDVTHRIYRMPSGKARGVVIIPNPPTADFESIRLALVATIFQTALYSRAKNVAQVTPPPVWFLRGLALHSDPAQRLRLFDTAYGFWSHANLPQVQVLLSSNSPAFENPAVAAQLVAWCVGREKLAQRWNTLLDHLAEGGAWDASTLGAIFRDIDSPAELDDDFNLWLAKRPNHILEIGSTGPTTLTRLRSQLLIYPWESDIYYLIRKFPAKGISLGASLMHGDRPEVRSIIQDRIQRFHLMAIGRDPLFQALCGDYIASLQEALKPGHGKEAIVLWKKAENARLNLETRLAAGEILK